MIYVYLQQQYVFIHDCVNEILERKRQALMEQDNIYVNQGFGKSLSAYIYGSYYQNC